MGARIGLFLGWKNGIGVTGIGFGRWEWGMKSLKIENGIEIMPVDFQFFALFKMQH